MRILIYRPATDGVDEKLLASSYLRRGDRHWYSAATNLYNTIPYLRPEGEPFRHPRSAPVIVGHPAPGLTRYQMTFGYLRPTGTMALDEPVIVEVDGDW